MACQRGRYPRWSLGGSLRNISSRRIRPPVIIYQLLAYEDRLYKWRVGKLRKDAWPNYPLLGEHGRRRFLSILAGQLCDMLRFLTCENIVPTIKFGRGITDGYVFRIVFPDPEETSCSRNRDFLQDQ